MVHPLWVHIPAVAVIAGTVAYSVVHGRVSSEVAVLAVMSVFYIGLSVLGDELWARQETRKTFNWLSLFDEALAGFLAGTIISSPGDTALWLMPVCAVAAGAILELARTYRPFEQRIVHEDTSALDQQIRESRAVGRPWLYCDVQNPWWMNVIAVVSGVWLVVAGVTTYRDAAWLAAVLLAIAAFLFGLYGGLRTCVTSDGVEVRMGIFRMLRIRTADIATAELHTFSPLREFGGYGIRYGKGIKAFFLRGNRGVLITTLSGRKYLIGSDHPERLAAAICAVIEQQIR